MRPLALAFILLCAASVVARAQQQQAAPAPTENPPGLEVVKFGWSKERLGWERDPFSGPVENFDQMRVRTRNEKRINDAKREGSAVDLDRVTREAKADAANVEQLRRQQEQPARYGFMYKVSVRNTGAQAVKSLDWDHVFFDTDTKVETGRHKFTADEKIAPGKQKEFSIFASLPPSRTVSVHKLQKRERDRIGETIVIMRVVYADGSVWQRP